MDRVCPLKRKYNGRITEFDLCEKDKCEWWSNYFKECAITSIGFIGFELMKIRTEKDLTTMPDAHEGDGINVNKE